MSEAVDILVSVDDKASRKFADINRSVDTQIKGIKEVGGRAKGSADFVRQLANAMGGTQFGAYLGQIGEISEKTGKFAEISKAGAAGAVAFKVGLAAVVGVLAFQAGKAISEWVLGVQNSEAAMKKHSEAAKQMHADMQRIANVRFSESREEIELIRDPEQKRQAMETLFASVKQEIAGTERQINASRKSIDDMTANSAKAFLNTHFVQAEQDRLDMARDNLKALQAQSQELTHQLSDRKRDLDLQREANQLADQSDKYLDGLRDELELLRATKDERIAIEAKRNTVTSATAEAEALMREKDLLVEKQKAQEEEIKRHEQLEERYRRELQLIEERRIGIEQGAEAAKRFALESEGLSKGKAAEIARRQTEVNQLGRGEQAPTLVGTISRLLTRGPAQDKTDKLIANTDKLPERIAEEIYKREKANAIPPRLQVEVIG